MFATPSAPQTRSEPVPSATPARIPEAARPGEFTQMFSNKSPSPPFRSDPPSPVKPAQEGEFTRMMASPIARSGLKPEPFSPIEQPPAKTRDAGAFTRMMESPRILEPELPPAPAPPRSSPSAPFPADSGQPAIPKGPSEFTQMFKAPAKEPVVEKKPPQAKAPRVVPRKKKRNAPLIWILVACGVLLIVGLVVVFLWN